MSAVTVEEYKAWHPVIHSGDDVTLQTLIDAAEDFVKRFCDRSELPTLPLDNPPLYDSSSSELPEDVPSSEDPIAPSVRLAIYHLVKADYRADPSDAERFRAAAERMCWPYRARLGA